MDRRRKNQQARRTNTTTTTTTTTTITTCCSNEASSIEWEFINMSEQEEDLIYRMYRLVGDSWALIAGRISGRKAEEIERFRVMRHGEVFADRRRRQQQQQLRREKSYHSTLIFHSTSCLVKSFAFVFQFEFLRFVLCEGGNWGLLGYLVQVFLVLSGF